MPASASDNTPVDAARTISQRGAVTKAIVDTGARPVYRY
jgi:hypothetical protein